MLKDADFVERLALGFAIGAGISTFLWFFLSLLGFSITLFLLVLVSCFSSLLGTFLTRSYPVATISFVRPARHGSPLIYLILGVSALALIISAYSPVTAWDALTLYDFRGIVIAQSHSLRDIEISSYYLSYPLFTSLVHAATYMLGGLNPNFFYSLFYLSLLTIVYSRTKRLTNSLYASIAAIFVATSPFLFEHATISYTNLPYALFFVGSVLYAPLSLILSGILLALSVWTRTAEPFWILAILYQSYLSLKNKNYRDLALAILIFFSIKMSWSNYLASVYAAHGFAKGLAHSYNLDTMVKMYVNLPQVLHYFYEFILLPHLGLSGVIFASLITFIQQRKLRSILTPFLLLLFSLVGMVVGGIAIFSTYYASWYSIGGSATRMVIFLIPLIIVLGAQALYHQNHHDKK